MDPQPLHSETQHHSDRPAMAHEVEAIRRKQAIDNERLTRVETSLESLVSTVDKMAHTSLQSHRETTEHFSQVHEKMDSIRELFAASRTTLWGPIIAAIVAGAGFVSLVVSPISDRTGRNDQRIEQLRGEIWEAAVRSGRHAEAIQNLAGRLDRRAEQR